MKITWKKNYRKVPDKILEKIKILSDDSFVVAVVKKISAMEIASGVYNHLGLQLQGNKVIFPKQVVPQPHMGRFSQRNVEGEELIRKDLPKVTKTYSWDAPDYGDWSKGSHEVSIDRKVYRRDFLHPSEIDITVELLQKEGTGANSQFTFKFLVNDVIDRTESDFKDRLFFNLNLLQENVGAIDVFISDASREDYLKTTQVNWQLLPPGEREETINRIISLMKVKDSKIRKKIESRFKTLSRLKPLEYIIGTDHFRRYFGAKFAEDLVVFENLDYGNAIYVMFDNWRDLSKRSRLDLLSSDSADFARIIHVGTWKTKLSDIVKSKLKK